MIKYIMLSFLIIVTFASSAVADGLALIVNRDNPVTALRLEEVRLIFLGKKSTWQNGRNIVPIIQENSRVHSQFSQELIAKTPQQFTMYWKKQLFTGTGIPPRTVKSDGEVKAFVAAKSGAIGYIAESSLDETVKKMEVK